MRSSARVRSPSGRRFQHQSRIGVTIDEAIPVDRLLAAVAGRYGAALDDVATLAATEPLPVLHLVAPGHRADRGARSHGLLHLLLFGFMKLRFWGRRGSGSVHAAHGGTGGDPHLAGVKLSRWLCRLAAAGHSARSGTAWHAKTILPRQRQRGRPTVGRNLESLQSSTEPSDYASVAIRLPRALRSRLAEVTALLNQSPPPGSGFIRASESLVARLALARGLDALAAEARCRGDSAEGE